MTKTYPLIDPASLVAKIAELGGPVIEPSEPNGVATSHGVKLGWAILNGQITVTVLSKPFYVPQNVIWEHVDKLLGPEAA